MKSVIRGVYHHTVALQLICDAKKINSFVFFVVFVLHRDDRFRLHLKLFLFFTIIRGELRPSQCKKRTEDNSHLNSSIVPAVDFYPEMRRYKYTNGVHLDQFWVRFNQLMSGALKPVAAAGLNCLLTKHTTMLPTRPVGKRSNQR